MVEEAASLEVPEQSEWGVVEAEVEAEVGASVVTAVVASEVASVGGAGVVGGAGLLAFATADLYLGRFSFNLSLASKDPSSLSL